jgi:two-component system, NarL family, nitrate/nitrite response regulator NarL
MHTIESAYTASTEPRACAVTSTDISLLIVDDHPVLRDSLATLLHVHNPRIKVLAQAGGGHEALLLAQQYLPDIVVTDLQMTPMSGVDVLIQLRQICPTIRYVVFTALTSTEHLLQAFDAGAQGFVTKDAQAQELIKAIDAVMTGATYYPSALKQALLRRQAQPQLTPREREVLALVAQGLTSKAIARRLLIDARTVDVHRANIRQRFNLDSSAALMRFAITSTSEVFSADPRIR